MNDKKKTRKKNKKKMNLSASDYRKILKFYKLSIPKKLANLRKKGDKIIAKKFCSCIKKVRAKFKKEGIALSVCTKSVITRKAIKRGKFKCKKRRSIKLLKGRSKRSKRRAKKKINQSGGTFGQGYSDDDSTYDSDDSTFGTTFGTTFGSTSGSRVESSIGSEEEDDIYEYKNFTNYCEELNQDYVQAIINKLKDELDDLKYSYKKKYGNDNIGTLLARMKIKHEKKLKKMAEGEVDYIFHAARQNALRQFRNETLC